MEKEIYIPESEDDHEEADHAFIYKSSKRHHYGISYTINTSSILVTYAVRMNTAPTKILSFAKPERKYSRDLWVISDLLGVSSDQAKRILLSHGISSQPELIQKRFNSPLR